MKNKFLVGILCIGVLLSATGCGSQTETKAQSVNGAETAVSSVHNQEEETESGGYYEELIAAARECNQKKDETMLEKYDFSSVILTSRDYERLGYLIEDIDGNGIDELIFGANGTEPDDAWDSIIYDIYTISDGELVHVLNGWERNRYYFCENGMIANEGSSGAANSSFAYFTFEESTLHLVESVICDGMKDADHPWFYSTESKYDAENAEPISEEKSVEIREKYVYEHPEFIPFAKD